MTNEIRCEEGALPLKALVVTWDERDGEIWAYIGQEHVGKVCQTKDRFWAWCMFRVLTPDFRLSANTSTGWSDKAQAKREFEKAVRILTENR